MLAFGLSEKAPGRLRNESSYKMTLPALLAFICQ